MSEVFENNLKIGVLGGGQLGRMLYHRATHLNVDISFMDPDKFAPCNGISQKFVVGDLNNYNHVMEFCKNLDVVSIEIENVNVEALQDLQNQGKKVYPQPEVIKLIKDKGAQKLFYQSNNIPTAPFYLIDDISELNTHLSSFPMVQKMRSGGYDGKGVTILKDESSLQNAFPGPTLLEEKIPFIKELSVLIARNSKGETVTYPIVEQEFNEEANLVELLFAPSDVSEAIELKAKEIAENIIASLDMIGLLAVELFLTADGDLLVNEIAPRPHNSGHHTIEANYESQYGQLLRCLLDFPLGSSSIISPAVMINLLGEKGYEGLAKYEGLKEVSKLPGVFVHLYGKKTTKPFRKMGHVTILASTIQEAREIALKVKNTLKVIA